jgi:hypothetical protein
MMDQNAFRKDGKWFKGNLHLHSTNSDGKLPPEEVAKIYKDKGWNFLAFTDHRLYTHYKEWNEKDFIVIPGVELDTTNPAPRRIYHVVGIGREACGEKNGFPHLYRFGQPAWEGLKTPQALIDKLLEGNNLAIFCHPIWSRLELTDFVDLKGYFAMELFNYGCEVENRTGLCLNYWDSLLRRGCKVWGVATDDAHHDMNDRCGGWVMVKCPELSQKAVVQALEEGYFYSSSGPELYGFEVRDGEAWVECSPVKSIHFVTYESVGISGFHADNGGKLVSARYKLRGDEKYVRVECTDETGATAWSNPIFLKG